MSALPRGRLRHVYLRGAGQRPAGRARRRSSGSVVRDGVEGLIVPERNAEAIADALTRIAADRRLRESMSAAALAAATRYSDEACGEQFIRVIQDFAKGESS